MAHRLLGNKRFGIAAKISVVNALAIAFLLLGASILIIRSEKELAASLIQVHIGKINQGLESKEGEQVNYLQENVQKNAQIMAQVCALPLYNFDTYGIHKAILPYMDFKEITAILISDSDGGPLAATWREGETKAEAKLPKDESLFLGSGKIELDSLHDKQKVGRVTVYYSDKLVRQQIQGQKKQAETEIGTLRENTLQKIRAAIFSQAMTVVVVIVILVALTSACLNFIVIRPVKFILGKIEEVSAGDLAVRVEVSSLDEIGDLGLALRRMIVNLLERAKLAETIANGDLTGEVAVSSAKDTLGFSLQTMVKNLSAMIKQIKGNAVLLSGSADDLSGISTNLAGGSEEMQLKSSDVASATEEMSTNINAMASAAEEMSVNVQTVSSAAEQMSQNMTVVAAAIEEMSTAMGGIADNSQASAAVSESAMAMAGKASETMRVLGEAAKEIGEVTKVIKRIADKTNLLALNATIEAASAGEAGKGFAVVANEIKELASQSAQAAENIAKRITGVQSNTGEAVKAIADISGIIGRINESVRGITTSVSEQTNTTSEISANIQQANSGVRNIASSMGEISSGANDMSRNAGEAAKAANEVAVNIQMLSSSTREVSDNSRQVNDSAGKLTDVAGQLLQLVERFRIREGEKS